MSTSLIIFQRGGGGFLALLVFLAPTERCLCAVLTSLAFIGITLAAPQTSSQTPPANAAQPSVVRVDGVYEAKDPSRERLSFYIRFFEDGTVYTAESRRGDADGIASLSKRDIIPTEIVPYKIQDTKIEFALSYAGVITRYRGAVGATTLQLQVLRPGERTWVDREYTFITSKLARLDDTGQGTLRFDGVYRRFVEGYEHLFRFYPDGVLTEVFTTWLGDAAKTFVRDDPRYRLMPYTLTAKSVAFSHAHNPVRFEATIQRDRLGRDRLEVMAFFTGDPIAGRSDYQFIPDVDLAAPDGPYAPQITLLAGAALMDSACARVDFSPLAESQAFASGTTAIAYRVTIGNPVPDPDLRLDATVRCATSEVRWRGCQAFKPYAGRPALALRTAILSCVDGKPFEPGTYQFRLFGRDPKVPLRAVTFRIE